MTLKCLSFLFISITCVAYPVHSPQNTIIALDLDGVVIEGRASWSHILKSFSLLILQTNKKIELIKTMTYILYNRSTLDELSKYYADYAIVEQLAQKYPIIQSYYEPIIDMLTNGKPIEGTYSIIKDLYALGYTIIPSSNMSEMLYKKLIEKKILAKEFFSQEQHFLADNSLNREQDNMLTKKPDPRYFVHLKQYIKARFPTNNYEHVIFIDDKQENITGAQQADSTITTVLFISPEQLRIKLEQLGILIKTENAEITENYSN